MGKKNIYKDISTPWGWLFCGCLLIGISAYNLLTIKDDGYMSWKGIYVPTWTNWPLLPVGIGFTAISIYAFIRRKDNPTTCIKTYTDEEFAEAEAEMDALYLREYGELPEKPKPEIIESKTIEGEIAEPVKPKKTTE